MPAGLEPVAGIGLRDPHYARIDEQQPAIGWLEAHTENFFAEEPRLHRMLERLRQRYPLSLHGVGLSLGSEDPLDKEHLRQIAEVVRRYEPQLVSEHLCWSASGGRHSHQLLPLPHTREAVDILCAHIGQLQDALRRQVALEPIARYFEFAVAEMSEPQFIAEVVERTGCGLLLDVSNLHVNACNHGFNAKVWLDRIAPGAVVEYHMAGFDSREGILLDTHDRPVAPEVWDLYSYALRVIGPRPTLIEWDTDLPELDVLLGEMRHADQLLISSKSES